jgi:hypothetical protein
LHCVSTTACLGTVTLKPTAKNTKTVYATSSYVIPAGHTVAVTAKLSKKTRRLVHNHRHLAVKAIVTPHNGAAKAYSLTLRG